MASHAAAHQTAQPQRADPQRCGLHRAPQGPSFVRSGITRLQSTAGNRAIHRFLSSSAIQPKLTVGPADDEYEREADRVAGEVMRMPNSTPLIHRTAPQISRKCLECEKEEEESGV